MVRPLDEVTSDVLDLPRGQRMSLVRLVLEAEEMQSQDAKEAAWEEEIRSRWEGYQAGKIAAIPLEAIKEKYRARLQG